MQPALSIRHRNHFDLRAGQVAIGGNQKQVLDLRWKNEHVGRAFAHECFVRRAGFRALPFETDAAREIPLGIDIDQKDRTSLEGERSRDVDGCRGLADPPLLIGDGDNPSMCGRLWS